MAKRRAESQIVGNHPDFLVCRWHATHCWKALDEGYNTTLLQISSQLEVYTQSYGLAKLGES